MVRNEWNHYHDYLNKNHLTYFQYTNSEHWKQVRNRFYKRLNHKSQCEACKSKKKLNLHHKTYERIGHEKLSDLALLCNLCHRRVHREHSRNNLTLWATTEKFICSRGKVNLSLWDWLFGKSLSKF